MAPGDVARRAAVARSVMSDVELGHLEDVSLRTLRRIAAALDIRVDLLPRWRGGELPRLLGARHSALHEVFARALTAFVGWTHVPEASFAVYGERGVIDVLGWHDGRGALLVVELKSEIVDIQEMLATLDRKCRLATRVAAERGFGPVATVSAWLIIREDRTNRRHVVHHASPLRSAFAEDGRTMQRWLRDPTRPVRALSFMPIVAVGDHNRHLGAVSRVRCHRRCRPERGRCPDDATSGR